MKYRHIAIALVICFFVVCPVMSGELHDATVMGDIRRIKELLSKGANINELGWPKTKDGEFQGAPLHWAVFAEKEKAVLFLIKNGADINSIGQDCCDKITPLDLAVLRQNTKIIKTLLDAGANVEGILDNSDWPLKKAIAIGDFGIAQILLNYGANMHREDDYLLYDSIASNKSESLIYILSKGIDVNKAISSSGMLRTPLSYAIASGNLIMTELLIKQGANIDRNINGSSPLHIAINEIDASFNRLNREPIIKLLISKTVNINLCDENGNTPLHIAVEKNNQNIVSLLLEKNAIVDVKNKSGMTPLQLAEKTKNKVIIDLLR